jgi:bifunctional ADP-heptose synthase (sugar kinase/adenylyltransferase)
LKELKEGLKSDFNPDDRDSLQQTVQLLKDTLQCKGALITMSERGVYIDFSEEQHHLPAHVRHIADVSGAGDTVISIAACCLAMKLPADKIAGLSNLGGGLVCEKVGVVPIEKQRLLEEALRLGIF